MTLREEIAEGLLQKKSIYTNLEKPFVFKSGRISPVYVDTRRLISMPDIRKKIVDAWMEVLEKDIGMENFDVIAGGESAGIPYAGFLAERTGKPMIFIRKKPKGYGGGKQVEGLLEKGQKVVLIEDLITD